MAESVTQDPAPGTARLVHSGDLITITLRTPPGGKAWLRTNAIVALTRQTEIIDAAEKGAPRPGQDWRDLPMRRESPGVWSCDLRITDPGCFEAKAYWLPDAASQPQWAAGANGNLRIKVQPAWTASQCSIYKAFVRMFRPAPRADPDVSSLEAAGWTVIPPSGTFRALAAEVPRIVDTMGFRIILLLPPFPVPTTHARMGRYGSPFAVMDYYAVDPACAEHDRRTTPLQQFDELIDAVHARGARLFIDLPINHTGWASQSMQRHPEWFRREPNGEFHSPGAWGVTWSDLVELDYSHRELWREMADVFLYWCRRGIDGFRCDAGYMVPVPVWEYITAKVRREFPDTIFLLEGLGGPVTVTLDLLTTGGLDWAYSELFQNYERSAIDCYLPQAVEQSATHGLYVNFAETHDNNRLAARGPLWARMRIAFSALTSPCGAWGITCGVEWLASEKIHVHGASPLHTGAEPNLVREIAALNKLLAEHPAFHADAVLELVTESAGHGIALRRKAATGGQDVLVLANLSDSEPATVRWKSREFSAGLDCLWTGEPVTVLNEGSLCSVSLPPGAVFCLPSGPFVAPGGQLSALSFEDCVVVALPRDERRIIVWPDPASMNLGIVAPSPFRASLLRGKTVIGTARSVPQADGVHRRIFIAANGGDALEVELYQHGNTRRMRIDLVVPEGGERPAAEFTGSAVRDDPALHVLLTNGTGAMSHIRAAWGTVQSQYDALLAANPDNSVPVDRRMLLTRCRAWIVRRGFSTELSAAWTTAVRRLSSQHAAWDFHLPCGDGHWIDLTLTVHLAVGKNRVALQFERRGGKSDDALLIVRPDIEDRGFHEKTHLPPDCLDSMTRATQAGASGFRQPCHHGSLCVGIEGSRFVFRPEGVTVSHPVDAARGMGGASDLYSPGYFECKLPRNGKAVLHAQLVLHGMEPVAASLPLPAAVPHSLKDALLQFVVRRDEGSTIIAGYPWFLDWGRDTLIVLRGLIAAGEIRTSRDILKTFAAFEDRGTLPNMIRGSDCSNRDTSDAPLWFCVATADLLAAENSNAFLDEPAGARPLREILRSIATHYISGTPNGIRMDPASGLIWSPAHFTWMDTNHPAATPREGYPVCIQSLWHRTLTLLAEIDPAGEWRALASTVRRSIATLFTVRSREFLSDCLHAPRGTAAADAIADDHLRPNQLFAVTLGALTDPGLTERIIASSMELLIPGSIRTLADRPVTVALPVERNGQLLNHPHAPFCPRYEGDEDTRRKPAYHNGTAWPWPMPSLAEAIVLTGGSPRRAKAILDSMKPLTGAFCLGQLPEIMHGAAPHTPGGCGAQAWSVSELLRVEKLLTARSTRAESSS